MAALILVVLNLRVLQTWNKAITTINLKVSFLPTGRL
jgi:hypothetical protein